jgi:hypothetical protein
LTSPAPELPTGLTLEPDYVTVPGQRFALVSFVGPELPQKNEQLGMKIRGVFATQDESSAHVKRIHESGDQSVDIFLMDMNKWCVIPPDPKKIEDQVYQEEFLNKLMHGAAESQRSVNQVFDNRRKGVREEGLDKHLLPNERLPVPTPEQVSAMQPVPWDGGAGTSAATGPTEVLDAMTNDTWTAGKGKAARE